MQTKERGNDLKRFILSGLIAVFILGILLVGCKAGPKYADLLNVLGEDLDLSSEMIEISGKGDLLKIDCIQPGLDIYDLRVILYSLSSGKQLCEVSLGEDAWNTGLTRDGFYAISLLRQEVVLYDLKGSEVFRKRFSDAGNLWAFGMLNEDADYLLFGRSDSAEIIRYSLTDNKQTTVGKINGYIQGLGCRDNFFYLHKAQGELLRVDLKDKAMESVYYDPAVNFYTMDYGIGTKDTNFLAVSANPRSTVNEIPMTSVDEVPLAAYESGFATLASKQDDDIIRVYHIPDGKVKEVTVQDRVQQAIFLDENTLVAVAKEANQKNRIYYCNLSKTDFAAENVSSAPELLPEALVASSHVSGGTLIENVPLIAQMPAYPTGCESVSAVMALRFAGEIISVDEFIDKHLKKSTNFYVSNGIKYGPSPWEHFIGSPRSKASYGCMAPVIEEALKSYFGSAQRVVNTTGRTLDELCAEYIDRHIPVMVWVSINMIDTYPTNTWTLSDGRAYTWIANEHCMVLIGYDKQYYYFNDPYTGKRVKFEKSLSQKRSDTFDRQSLVVLKM